ncbi:hypothetical protein C1645_772753 [Glomus cerebriforme]|uniref:Uncharacterized protein n=1 Tax=Glomus cerebriforme TaxID=658196 RepID=A0A397ST52_9GLOM|nr:hypothetical protein C1645_772753 [Glomus cerebriforme]
MLKNVKALVEPLERLMTTLGTRGPKSSTTTHSGGHSQITCFTKQQVSEIKQITVNNFSNSTKTLEQTSLRNFLFENFSIFKTFSPQPVPIPVVFSQTPLRVCKPQRFGIISQHAFLHPAGSRNIIGRCGNRNFSSFQPAIINNGTGGGGTVLAQLGLRPFFAFSKSGSLWFQREEGLDNNKFVGIKRSKVERKKETIGRKLFVQSNDKGIFEIVKNFEDNKNVPRVVRRSSIKKSLEKNKVIENDPEVFIDDNENVQVYMSIILSSSIFWNIDDNSTSASNSTNSINSTTSILSYLLQCRNNTVSQRHNSRLNSSFIQHLQEIAEMQHDHMMEVISILGALLQHDDFEAKISGCELRIYFPRGMQKIEIENMLQSLNIDPHSSHFELEELIFDKNIEISPLTGEGFNMQLPEPNNSYFDNTTIDFSPSSPGYEFLSYSSSSDSSPVLLSSRGSDRISGFSSPCNSPPRLGAEYISGIQEFLNAVDEALVRNSNMFSNREDDEIGEDYYEN